MIKCPQCGEYQMRIEQGDGTHEQDAVCLACHLRIPLKDLRNYKPKE